MNLKIIPPPHLTAEVIHALTIQIRRTRIQHGCIECHLSQDVHEQNIILYQEDWQSWEEIEKYIRSRLFTWVLELMEKSCHSPELSFNEIHETRGMDYVRNLRPQITSPGMP